MNQNTYKGYCEEIKQYQKKIKNLKPIPEKEWNRLKQDSFKIAKTLKKLSTV